MVPLISPTAVAKYGRGARAPPRTRKDRFQVAEKGCRSTDSLEPKMHKCTLQGSPEKRGVGPRIAWNPRCKDTHQIHVNPDLLFPN